MSLDNQGRPQDDDRRAARIRLAKLEADIAYFQTRLQLIGELNSTYRLAQHKAFKILLQVAARQVFAARRNRS